MNISKNIGYKDYLTYTDSQKYNILIKREEEIERLNNIINELENYIKERCWKDEWGVESIYVKTLLNKLKELKGSDSNGN